MAQTQCAPATAPAAVSEPAIVSPTRWPATAEMHYDALVVGAGFAGAVMAERLARVRGWRVLIIDRRSHIGGMAHDRYDEAGLLVQQYGPHIFRAGNTAVRDYMARFTRWHELPGTGGALPDRGFSQLFSRLLDHDRIEIMLGVDHAAIAQAYAHDHVIYTGGIDAYYGYRHGSLSYHALRFEHETLDQEWFQPRAVRHGMEAERPLWRITEHKRLTGQRSNRTSITREFVTTAGEPAYPVRRPDDCRRFARYLDLARREPRTVFVGRLAAYRYLRMDQTVAQALDLFARRFAKAA